TSPPPAPAPSAAPAVSDELPRRIPGARIPDLGPQREDSDAPQRDEVDVAAQLSGFQDGVERARAEGPHDEDEDEDPMTPGGLERRVAGAHMPDTGPPRDSSATPPSRNPDDVRTALTSFQYGVARGTLERAESNGEEPT